MDSPVRMNTFVIVEARQPHLITGNPDMGRSQIEIRAADETDKFKAVPNVRIRNEHYGFGLHNDRGRRWHRGDYYRRRDVNAAVRIDNAAG